MRLDYERIYPNHLGGDMTIELVFSQNSFSFPYEDSDRPSRFVFSYIQRILIILVLPFLQMKCLIWDQLLFFFRLIWIFSFCVVNHQMLTVVSGTLILLQMTDKNSASESSMPENFVANGSLPYTGLYHLLMIPVIRSLLRWWTGLSGIKYTSTISWVNGFTKIVRYILFWQYPKGLWRCALQPSQWMWTGWYPWLGKEKIVFMKSLITKIHLESEQHVNSVVI